MTAPRVTDSAHAEDPSPLDGLAFDDPRAPADADGWDTTSDALLGRSAVWEDEPAKTAPRIPATPRRGPADPVKALMHRHRELCQRAVDPLEIAAGLEAHGVTDRTAARFRHRDVFSLAEELYARVPRGESQTPARPGRGLPRPAAAGFPLVLLTLLPGALCALAVAGLHPLEGTPRTAATVTGAVAVTVALSLCLRRGPLRAQRRTVPALRLWTLWLLAYAAYGTDLPTRIMGGGETTPALSAGPLVGLALAVAPAAWCAHLFSVQARRRLDGSRGLEEFASGVRPLLLGVVALYVGVLTALLAVTRLALPYDDLAPAVGLGVLLFLARLLVVHHFPAAAATGLAAACAVEAAAILLLLAGRLPGGGFLATPVEAAVTAWGASAVPAAACAAAAAGLLAHATAALSRASAHTE
ncbi:hypothetical protein ACFWU3_03000 [Streptomyces sp. NPDC058685]|uniref:hypothetical protein n=1 Tax=Streptomyces sp. NPDC058685 TaxID=3346598 RepID=UPI00365CEE25